MFFEISKFLNIFVIAPLTWMTVLLVVAVWVKSRKGKKWLVVAAAAVFLVFTDRPLYDAALHSWTRSVRDTTMQPGKVYEAAVVLGGFSFINPDNGVLCYNGDRGDRLWEAVRLWRAGIVRRILITGDNATNSAAPDTLEEFYAYMESMGVPREAFLVEREALNTRQNALYSEEMLRPLGISLDDCVVVTSAVHMPRSKGCFLKIGSNPAFFATGIPWSSTEGLTHRSFYPSWRTAVDWQDLFNEYVGICVYKVMGYI